MAIEITKIDYPIAQDDITVQSIFNNLKVISTSELKFAVEKGEVCIGGKPCGSIKDKVYDRQILTYSDFEITVGQCDEEKCKRLMAELLKGDGYRGNSMLGVAGAGYSSNHM